MKKYFAIVALMFASCSMSMAWNCSNPLAERVVVPSGTSGTYGDGNGQLALYNGQLYECEVVPPPTPTPSPTPTPKPTPTPTPSPTPVPYSGGPTKITNTNINTNSNSNTSSSNSTSGATSGSTSSATGGSVTGSGNSTSTSGVKNSGNSSSTSGVKSSGNSANTNTTSATGGNQQQSNALTNSNVSAATSNGDNSNDSTSITNVKPAASSAFAPTGFSTAPCLASFGAGAQTIPGGISFGGNRVDKGCDDRATAMQFALLLHNRLAAAKILCTTKAARRAKLTMEDCMATVEPTPVEVAAPVVIAAPVVAPVVAPAPVSTTEVYVITPDHISVEVTATKAQVLAAKKRVVHKVVHKPCPAPAQEK